MAKFVYIHSTETSTWESEVEIISRILSVGETAPYVQKSSREFIWISNPNGIVVEGFSLATGVLNPELSLSNVAQFSFRLIASDSETFLETDFAASRTVWYIIHEKLFIASSSQRAIVAMLGDFQLNRQSVSWMLCNGCLGPGNSWDVRIKSLGPNSSLSVEKKSHHINLQSGKSLTPANSELCDVFTKSFSEFNENSKWGITLSGGVDSRAVLYWMKKLNLQVESFTWGTKESILQAGSDSFVARQLSLNLEVPFTFLELEQGKYLPSEVLDNFIAHGEGRIDHINSFMDGLRMWKGIATMGLSGIVRSDEAFGWLDVRNEKDTRISLDLNLPEDYRNIASLFKVSQVLENPRWPDEYKRQHDESLEQWRDRLYRNYRIPYIIAALQDLPLSFIEIFNPLLTDEFMKWVLCQKDIARSNKRKFRSYVDTLNLDVPFANWPAIPEPEEIVMQEGYRFAIMHTLQSTEAREVLGEELVSQLLNMKLNQDTLQKSFDLWKERVSRVVPFRLKKLIRSTVAPYQIHSGRILLRAFIIVAMIRKLQSDLSKTKVLHG